MILGQQQFRKVFLGLQEELEAKYLASHYL